MGHKRLSASQTKQWWYCPGSLALIQQMGGVDNPSGDAANQGTCAHFLAETCLRKGQNAEAYMDRVIAIIGDDEGCSILKAGAKTANLKGYWTIVDSDMIDAVQVHLDYIHKRCHELGLFDGLWDESVAHAIDTKDYMAGLVAELVKLGKVRLEVKVNPLPDRDDTGGSSDVVIDAWPDVLEAVDYKHGQGVFVPVVKNLQLRTYVSGNAVLDGWTHDRYRYTITQPRHRLASPWGGVMSEEASREEMMAWTAELALKAQRVDIADGILGEGGTQQDLFEAGLLSVGEDGGHCTWCPLKNNCVAATAKTQEVCGMDFANPPEKLDAPGQNMLPMILPWVPFIDAYLREAEASVERILLAGGSVDGKKLVRKKSNRAWKPGMTDTERAAAISAEYDVPVDKLLVSEPYHITGPQTEKLLPKAKRAEFSAKYMHKPEGGLTVADASDPRDAITPSVGDDFDAPAADTGTDFDDPT